MSKKTTKRALAMSFVSVFLCVCMLVGTTFAWFTDSVTSAGNKIVAGTLDVELHLWNGTSYEDISTSDDPIFGGANSLVAQNNNADTLWEPGKTQVAYLAIKNNGNLALEYTVELNVQNVSKELYEVMQYAITPDAKNGTGAPAWTSGESVALGVNTTQAVDVEMAPGATHYFALSIHMDEMAGNKYQGGKVNFDLTVIANQKDYESDSFGTDYDKDANVYNVTDTASAQKALDAAEDGAIINFDANGTYGMLYFRQSEASEIVHDRDFLQSVYDEVKLRTFKDLTINGNGATITGFATEAGAYNNTAHSNSAVYPVLDSFIVMENVKISGFTFDGTANAFNFVGKNSIDGLTISDCRMPQNAQHNWEYDFVFVTADQATVSNVNGETFVVKFANVKIDNCSADYIKRFIMAHFSENLTVTNNRVSNLDETFVNPQGGAYWDKAHTGTMTFTGNKLTNVTDRFLRAAKVGDAHIVLEKNIVNSPFYQSTETNTDLVKVNVIENVTYTNDQNIVNSSTAVTTFDVTIVNP